MRALHPLPRLWLFTDQRNRESLFEGIKRLPAGSGIIFRDYDLSPEERAERLKRVSWLARASHHIVLVAGDPVAGETWLAHGSHNRSRSGLGLRSQSVHTRRELAQAIRARANLVFISPLFATRSHPDHPPLEIKQACNMAATAPMPCIALGGMTHARFKRLSNRGFYGWGAIDALS